MLAATADAHMHVQPRHVHRRQRQPGARERNSTRRLRLQSPTTPSMTPQYHLTRSGTQHQSTYSYDSTIHDFCLNVSNTSNTKPVQEEAFISKCQEPTTVADIRKSIERTSRPSTCPPGSTRRPEWSANLDINLDLSALDVVPPYDDTENTCDDNTNTNNNPYLSQSFCEAVSLTYLDTEADDEDSDIYERKMTNTKLEINYSKSHSSDTRSIPTSNRPNTASGSHSVSNDGNIGGNGRTGNETRRIETNTFKTTRPLSSMSMSTGKVCKFLI